MGKQPLTASKVDVALQFRDVGAESLTPYGAKRLQSGIGAITLLLDPGQPQTADVGEHRFRGSGNCSLQMPIGPIVVSIGDRVPRPVPS